MGDQRLHRLLIKGQGRVRKIQMDKKVQPQAPGPLFCLQPPG